MTEPAYLTERQEEALSFIRDYMEAHDRSPTMDEIGRGLGISAPTAWQHVNALVQKGYLFVQNRKARSITIRDKRYMPDNTLEAKVRRRMAIDEEFKTFILEISDEIRSGDLQPSAKSGSNRTQ